VRSHLKMDHQSLYAHIFESPMFEKWHWFRWHFERTLRGSEHPLCKAFVDACMDCERIIPGFAEGMADRMTSISGKEKFVPHFEQLLQLLAEIHVIRQLLTFDWGPRAKFQWEPKPPLSKKNPELVIELPQLAHGSRPKAQLQSDSAAR
jgi:hypothetical protein